MKNVIEIIKCPVCGMEYLPAEIYIPKVFIGNPTDIVKDSIDGKVTDFFGSNMNLDETYVCDRCNSPFKIHTKIQFFTQPISTSEYKTPIKKPSLFLSEQ